MDIEKLREMVDKIIEEHEKESKDKQEKDKN